MPRLPEALRAEREHAQTVRCRRVKCGQPIGSTCLNESTGVPLSIQSAHLERITDADRKACLAVACLGHLDGCGAEPFDPCVDPGSITPPHPTGVPFCEARRRTAGVFRARLDPHDLQSPVYRTPESKELLYRQARKDLDARRPDPSEVTAAIARRHAAEQLADLDGPPDDDQPEPLWATSADDEREDAHWVRGPRGVGS